MASKLRGFKTRKTAYATIKGLKVMRALKKKQVVKTFQIQPGIRGEVRLIERVFGLDQDVLSECTDFYRDDREKLGRAMEF